MQIGLPLAGTGIRGVRLLLELKKGKIKHISINDYDEKAVKVIKQNIKLNRIKTSGKITITKKDANIFILESSGFDYIDIDPFGSPNYFLDSAVKRLARNGLLAVTATDTSALAGSFPSACIRKYWAAPLRNELKHEAGLRIMIRKVQLIGAQFDKALTPVYSYAEQHYMRVFFRCEKGKHRVDKLLKQHGMLGNAGPMWLGQLWDKMLASAVAKQGDKKILKTISAESKINAVGFHDIHRICKRNKIKNIPKFSEILKRIKKKYKASQTHFSPTGIRSSMPEKELVKIIKSIR
jgi:tRNA (guanine26-N2/guanine27-N2)-dimethyltransferase